MKCFCLIHLFLNSANLICRGKDISKYFRESLRLRDNESRLHLQFWAASDMKSDNYQLYMCHPLETDREMNRSSVWSKSSLSAWNNCIFDYPKSAERRFWIHSRMHRLIWFFARRSFPKVRFLTLRLKVPHSEYTVGSETDGLSQQKRSVTRWNVTIFVCTC